MTGFKLNETLGKVHFWTMFIFFNLTFFPLFAAGMLGMPRRVSNYNADLHTLNVFVSVAAFCLGVSMLMFLGNLVWSLVFKRERAGDEPVAVARASSGRLPSPPPVHNFERIPTITRTPYGYGMPDAPPVADLRSARARGRGGRGMSARGAAAHRSAPRIRRSSARTSRIGARLLASAVVFLFMSFVFAFFYLRALNTNHSFRPPHVNPPQGWGIAVLVCVLVVDCAVFDRAQRRARCATGAAQRWRRRRSAALAARAGRGRAAGDRVLQPARSAPTDGGFASVFCGFTAGVRLLCWLGAVYWMETLVGADAAPAAAGRRVALAGAAAARGRLHRLPVHDWRRSRSSRSSCLYLVK